MVDGTERKKDIDETDIEKLSVSDPSQATSLPQLLLSSVEFCFDTQAYQLEMPYDLKISQCLVAMHSFLQLELVDLR